ncbi:lytic murein transglycosylase [Microbacterium sp. cx-55]|uniref:lytic transglycosylase domain-containing protein n=1 Tax=Microbacterium sp. cx-55 TaxID=2875948 RepID=UPI001CC00C77|nr:lytic murein transglycosylase [Microbacterium sp. cx-55]UGB35902.1 lytic murein transglycosylase [Microbacterium sp. cx-55]
MPLPHPPPTVAASGGLRWSRVAGGIVIVTALCVAGAVLVRPTDVGPGAAPAAVPVVSAAVAPVAEALPAGEAAAGAAATVESVSVVVAPDAGWVEATAARTGIPVRALEAYARADLVIDAEQPGCGIGWNTIAGIAAIESDHGRHGGAVLGADGYSTPTIRGAALDGRGVAAIPDTDGGAWDGDAVWDRAVGPLQFIPATWSTWGADGNGDGAADPNQIDDAALAAARYLCASGEMTTVGGWRTAVFSYNHLDVYVDDVARVAQQYGASG